MPSPWNPSHSISNNMIYLDDVEISFHRTIRVPDRETVSALPPSLGTFPLYEVKNFLGKLPYEMSAKGGLFMPLYQREAIWIEFRSKQPYAIKIYVGGVNAISGEPMIETAATRLRRQNLMRQNKSVQDYIVIPEQRWLDGIATRSGQVRQFVAMPLGSRYSVEMQMTGQEVTGGLQFEITPSERELVRLNITLTGKDIEIVCESTCMVEEVMRKVSEKEGIPIVMQRFIWAGKQLLPDFTLAEYGIHRESVIHLVLRLRGGGTSNIQPPVSGQPEMGIAAGGVIKQSIVRDPGRLWRKSETKTFNIQILNSIHFRHVTGKEPPKTPIDARTYAQLGYPFYSIYEEPSDIAGDFLDVKSIGQIDGFWEPNIHPKAIRNLHAQVGFWNPESLVAEFRDMDALETEIRQHGATLF
ncbi:hypothetical protein K469DRAFT_543570 [Zopfia rhizophila CBS 207.26]|uniref:Ubiquitin-like domain-containing protein n=1 Tax=Zopfia rhizophila CBS 207.26 TaxID=1314779 RepID=A0A6A6EXR9_9PEZI|nr:hypothetical protein K469DRAFT_543570 [Zopfia rhizophila CBS 207.26]